MSMAILAIGHGSGMAVRQCSNSEVSSGVILGKVPPVGWYCCFIQFGCKGQRNGACPWVGVGWDMAGS